MVKYSSSQLLQVFINDSQLLSMITSGYWRWEPLKTVTNGSQSFSVVATQWLPCSNGYQWTIHNRCILYNGCQFSMDVSGYKWFSVVTSVTELLPVLFFFLFYFRELNFCGWSQPQNYFNSENFPIYGSQWLPIAFNATSSSPCLPCSGCQWFSMFLYGSQWF